MRFVIGLDQLSLGARTKCDIENLDGKVFIPGDTVITHNAIEDLANREVKGLFVSREDFLAADHQGTTSVFQGIGGKMAFPICESTYRETLSLAGKTLGLSDGITTFDLTALEDLIGRIQDEILANPVPVVSSGKKGETYNLLSHSVNVMLNMLLLANRLGMEGRKARMLAIGGLLHDVGKMAIDPAIINKPGLLDETEFTEVRQHPVNGLRSVWQHTRLQEETRHVILHHHERYDGRGYPIRLGRKTIPVAGRMMALIDAFDAMTSERAYADRLTPCEAMGRIIAASGTQFDPELAHELRALMGVYPNGTNVLLNTGETALVISQSEAKPLSPIIKIMESNSTSSFQAGRIIDISIDTKRFIKGEVKAIKPEENHSN